MPIVRQFPPGSRISRADVRLVMDAMAVIPELLPPRLFRVLQVRGWFTTQEAPYRLRARGWAKIADSNRVVHNKRSAAALVRHKADPYQVAQNARDRRARWAATHLPPSWKDTLAEMLTEVAELGQCARERDTMPLDGKDFLTIRDCHDGLLLVHDATANTIIGPLAPDGTLTREAKRGLRTWRLVPRGLVRAERVAADDDTITLRLYPTESGAQVTDSALSLTPN